MLTSLLPLTLGNHTTNSYASPFLMPPTFSMSRVARTPKVSTKPGFTRRSAHFRRNLRLNNGRFALILISLVRESMLKLLVTTLLVLLLMINPLQRQSEIQSGQPYASDVGRLDTVPTGATLLSLARLGDPFSSNGRLTGSSQSNLASKSVLCSMYEGPVPTKDPSGSVNIHALCAATPSMEHMPAPAIDPSSILYKVVTPYRPEVWKRHS